MSEKLIVVSTTGSEDPEKATLAYVMANAALAMDAEVIVCLQASGVYTVTKGVYEHIKTPGHDSIKKHVETFLSNGGKIFLCIPCCEERNITKEMVVDGCEFTKAGKAIKEILEANSVLNY